MQKLVHTLNPAGGQRARAGLSSGAVLLEIVLALALFAFAAVVIGGGLRSSIQSVDRLRMNMHAADLAVTALSEVQLGLRSVALTGPEFMEPPFDDWICEIVPAPSVEGALESTRYNNIEVVISRDEPPLVYRVGQLLRVEQSGSSDIWEDTTF